MHGNRLMLVIAIVAGILATILAFTYINAATSAAEEQEPEPQVSVLFVVNDLPANHALDPELENEATAATAHASHDPHRVAAGRVAGLLEAAGELALEPRAAPPRDRAHLDLRRGDRRHRREQDDRRERPDHGAPPSGAAGAASERTQRATQSRSCSLSGSRPSSGIGATGESPHRGSSESRSSR